MIEIGQSPTPLVIVTPPPAPATPAPSDPCPPGYFYSEDECVAKPFLAPIPEDYNLNGITSPTTHIYPVGESGTVYAVTIQRATAGVTMPEGIDYVINLGSKNGESQYGMIEMLGETEFKYDGGGARVLGNYHPAQSLDRWYRDNVGNPLVEEIRALVEKINAMNLCALPNSDPSPARVCRPYPEGYRFATPTPESGR